MNDAKVVDTKVRILDAAERLFAEHGFAETSLRDITTEAGTNLASVNYHFQSKDALIQAVLARRIAPVNAKRFAMLDALAAEAGDEPIPVEKLLRAMLEPMLEILCLREGKGGGRLVGRLLVEPGDLFEQVFNQQIRVVADRFGAAIRRSLPEVPETELYWRLFFTVGAVGHTMGGLHRIHVMSRGQCDPNDIKGAVDRLIAFVAAGFRAPAIAAEPGDPLCEASH